MFVLHDSNKSKWHGSVNVDLVQFYSWLKFYCPCSYDYGNVLQKKINQG